MWRRSVQSEFGRSSCWFQLRLFSFCLPDRQSSSPTIVYRASAALHEPLDAGGWLPNYLALPVAVAEDERSRISFFPIPTLQLVTAWRARSEAKRASMGDAIDVRGLSDSRI